MPDQNTGLLGIIPPFRILPDLPGYGDPMGGMQSNPSAMQFVNQLMSQPGGSPFGGQQPSFGTPWAFGVPFGLPTPQATIAGLPPAPEPSPTAPGGSFSTPTSPTYQQDSFDWWKAREGTSAGR